MPALKATEIKLWILWKEGVWRDFNLQFYTNKKHRIKKNSIGVSQISKILIGCHNSVWGLNEELRREGQCRAFRDAQKRCLGGRAYVNNNRNESSNVIFQAMIIMTWFTPCSWSPEGGTTGNSWWGCGARFSESWPYCRPKNVIFHTHFQTRSLKSIPIFGPGLI